LTDLKKLSQVYIGKETFDLFTFKKSEFVVLNGFNDSGQGCRFNLLHPESIPVGIFKIEPGRTNIDRMSGLQFQTNPAQRFFSDIIFLNREIKCIPFAAIISRKIFRAIISGIWITGTKDQKGQVDRQLRRCEGLPL